MEVFLTSVLLFQDIIGGSCLKNLDSVLPAREYISRIQSQRRTVLTVNSECEDSTISTFRVAKDHVEFGLGAIALDCMIGGSMDMPPFEDGSLVDAIIFVLESDGGFLGGIGIQREPWPVAPVQPCSNGSGRKVESGRVSK